MGVACCKVNQTEQLECTPPDEETLRFLAQVQLFKRLPADLHPTLASLSRKVDFDSDQVVIKQGDEGNEFFVIMSGTASVNIDGKVVATLKAGDYFGENALLRDEPRTATITAASPVSALRITREQFQRLGLQEKLEFAKRDAVGGGNKEIQVKPPTPKTAAERTLMEEALKANANLKTMMTLNDFQLTAMIGISWQEQVTAGTDIIRQGDLDADYFYIVQSGSFEVFVAGQEGKSAESAGAAVGSIDAGGSFGELALLYFAPRAATVKAKVNSVVWVIDRNNFKSILSKSSDNLAPQYVGYLKKVKVLAALKDDEYMEVANALMETTFTKGETIFNQGEKGDNFYILVSGSVSVIKDGKEEAKLSGTAENANFFGEQALLKNEPRGATITVISDTAMALSLDKASFDMLLGPLEEIKNRGAGGQSKVGHGKVPVVAAGAAERQFGSIRKKDLKRLGLLGCGGFGAVELVEHVKTGETFALKALSKGYIVKSGMQQSVMSEKNVQMLCDSAFVVKLFETFNGEQSLYFLLELALGGELYATYNKKDFYGKEPHAKFYAAGVVYAFDHMHQRKIIFRDLKPENLLLNEHGHVKVTDMGLAKICAGKTFTTCGTPDYFAPEVVQSAGHTRALDWWTLGILIFELIVGRPPFESPSPMLIYQKVVKGINKVNFPKKCKGPLEDLIKGLCRAEPSERLPMKKGGIANLQEHAWYQGFDWQAMQNLTMLAPYVPTVKSKKDIANFSARKEDMPPHVLYKDNGSGWDKDFATSS
mmetsp:Transcript_131755/g.421716  ORF Transcript_131755/g.421716 Transcript_131755/m.421716 type:complete len:768 (+) Transcript_131755:48-2351(+)